MIGFIRPLANLVNRNLKHNYKVLDLDRLGPISECLGNTLREVDNF